MNMFEPNQPYNFVAPPKIVSNKQKFKDPYSAKELYLSFRDYAPSNIMFDKRIYRGVTINALVIPTSSPQLPKPTLKSSLTSNKVT